MNERETVQQTLNKATRVLNVLELRSSGYTSLSIPAELQIELEDQRQKVAELQERLNELSRQSIETVDKVPIKTPNPMTSAETLPISISSPSHSGQNLFLPEEAFQAIKSYLRTQLADFARNDDLIKSINLLTRPGRMGETTNHLFQRRSMQRLATFMGVQKKVGNQRSQSLFRNVKNDTLIKKDSGYSPVTAVTQHSPTVLDIATQADNEPDSIWLGFTSDIPTSVPGPDNTREPVSAEEYLLKHTRITLLGAPGAGKSTTLRRLFRQFAQPFLNAANQPSLIKSTPNPPLIPIYVELNYWYNSENTLLHFLKAQVLRTGAVELANKLPELIQQGLIVLLLDGLNELPDLIKDSKSGLITDPRARTIAQLASEYPQTACVLSCRVNDFIGGPDWHDLHIADLDHQQIEDFALAYYQDVTDGELLVQGLINSLYGKESNQKEQLRSLITQPFYLVRLLEYYEYHKLKGLPDTIALPDNPALLLKFSIDEAFARAIENGRATETEISELNLRLAYLGFNIRTFA